MTVLGDEARVSLCRLLYAEYESMKPKDKHLISRQVRAILKQIVDRPSIDSGHSRRQV